MRSGTSAFTERRVTLFSKLASLAFGLAVFAGVPAAAGTPVYGYTVVHDYPHDPAAFTEGLFYLNGFLYESTGLEGKSDIRKVQLATGKVLERRPLDVLNGIAYDPEHDRLFVSGKLWPDLYEIKLTGPVPGVSAN
jgi:glutamine cyclotransferase